MENNDNLKNIAMLKKCNKIYTIMFWLYFATSIPAAAIHLIYGILENLAFTSANPFLCAGKIISMLLYFACGLMCIHEKENKYLIFLLPLTFIILFFSPINIIVTIISVLILPTVHRNYHWLEQQEGFPYFTELFCEQKKSLSEYKKDNPYQKTPDSYGDSPYKEENKDSPENNNPYQKILDNYKNYSGKMDEI